MAGVPFVFGNATTSIPLSNLDANFNTGVTIGNTTVGLGNTVTTLGNVTLTNVNIVSGTVPTANSIVNGTSNVVIASSGGAVNIATNGTQAITVDTSQNVGIGVVPSAWDTITPIQIKNASFGGYSFYSYMGANTYYQSGFKYISSDFASRYEQSAGGHKWYTAPSGTAGNAISFSQAMTLEYNGNLLVGTTSNFSAEKQCILFNGSTNNGLGLKDSADASGAFYQIFRNGSNTIIGSITRVGTTNAILYNTTSDYRLKTVVAPVVDAGTRLDALQPIEYDWKDGGRTRGFLAHQFAEVYPNSVSGEKDAVDKDGKPVYQSMQASTSEVMADLIAEIQSLRKRLTALEAK